jgi:hypothetical protein
MDKKTKVVPPRDLIAAKGKIDSNPNLDPDVINKRIQEAEEAEDKKKVSSLYVPKELKGLENLIFLGRNWKDVEIGDYTFTVSTITSKEQDLIFKKALELSESDRSLFFKQALLASSLKKINGKPIELYLEEGSFEEKLELVGQLQVSVSNYLMSHIEQITAEAGNLLKVENLKK